MMARRGVMRLLGGLAVVTVAGCDPFVRSASYRFRMTVEIETPQGLRRGSSVMEVVAQKGSFSLGDTTGNGVGLAGEAVIVDLPTGPVFVLLELPDARGPLASVATVALAPDARGGDGSNFFSAVKRLGGWFGSASAELPRESWPMMVRFRDINDPKSVERVDPQVIGVKRIALETTGDGMTVGIRDRLQWMGAFPETRLDQNYRGSTNPSIAQKLANGDFRRGGN